MSSLPPPSPGSSKRSAPSTRGRPPGSVQDNRTSGATVAILGIGLLASAALLVGAFLLIRGDTTSDDPAPGLSAPVEPGDTSPGGATPGDTAPGGESPGDTTPGGTTGPAADYGTGRCAPDRRPAEPRRTFEDAPRRCIDPSADLRAIVETNRGTFTIALDAESSPVTVNNFVNLARWGYYDGTGCHRVVADFLVQCGRPGDDDRAPGYTIPDELPAAGAYEEGVVAMANNGTPNSGGGQWFVVTGANGETLPPQFSIVGRVSKGYGSTVSALEALADPQADNGTPPRQRIRILSVRIVER